MILDKIIEVKKEEVAHRKRIRRLSELRHAIADMPEPHDFYKAINGRDLAIIAEVKRRSPSKGIFRHDFDPVRIARLYEENAAAAISVLTDRVFFGGDDTYLADIRRHVHLPLLRKDFITDPYQIYETRFLQGDAVLLIAAILTIDQMREFTGLARSLGLSVICEVHSTLDLAKALASDARIIGINNRNLRTFAVDLRTSESLAASIPSDRTIISESGIRTRQDIEALMMAGIHSFLIGESLMQTSDIGQKLRVLLGKS